MNKQISNAITRLRVLSTIIIVIYHSICPYGVWEAFTMTVCVDGNSINSMGNDKLYISKITLQHHATHVFQFKWDVVLWQKRYV